MNRNEKKVSIIMGIYNCEKTLSDSIHSILNQSYTNWDLILCDDSSTDRTFEIAKTFLQTEPRIILLQNERNMGLAATLNKCLEKADGFYILRHDGDDIMLPDRIEKQVAYMETHYCDACGSWAYLYDDTGVWGLRTEDEKPEKESLITDGPFIHPTVIMKSGKLREAGGYTINSLTKKRLEDYDLWVKFYERKYILRNIQEPLIYFREDKDSYKRKSKKFRWAETKMRLIACKRLKISFLKRLLAVKPLILIFFPKPALRLYQVRKHAGFLQSWTDAKPAVTIEKDSKGSFDFKEL